jgi:hypothetical protein
MGQSGPINTFLELLKKKMRESSKLAV